MFITKIALPRRTFLRGVGATLALPLLDAMVPAFTAVSRSAAAPVRRMGFIYTPNGYITQFWTPGQGRHQFRAQVVAQGARAVSGPDGDCFGARQLAGGSHGVVPGAAFSWKRGLDHGHARETD